MKTDPTMIYPDERPPGPLKPADASFVFPLSGVPWTRNTPPPGLCLRTEFDDDVEAGKGVAVAGKTFAAGRTADGKSYEDLFDLDFKVKDGWVEATLTPKGGFEITEDAYDAVRAIDAAWLEAFKKGVLGMKPERTQLGIVIFGTEPKSARVYDTRKLSGSEWERVIYHHTLTGEYRFPSAADAAAACEIVLSMTSGTSAVPTVTVSGQTLLITLRSSRGYLLTEVEFGLVREIDAALSEPQPTTE